jgi:hypothetical protein
MSASRFKRPRNWKSSARLAEPRMTRQLRRQFLRIKSWMEWRCSPTNAPRDESGVMKRKVRRSIAREIARKAGKELHGQS